MTEPGHPKDFDHSIKPANTIALVMALFVMGSMTLAGIGLALQGLWIIGVPLALVMGAWFVRTLIRRPTWRFGGGAHAPRRQRFGRR